MRKHIVIFILTIIASTYAYSQQTEADTASVLFVDTLKIEEKEIVGLRNDTNVVEGKQMINDSLTMLMNSTDSALSKIKTVKPQFKPDPNKSVWYALLFPGLGQIYNRKYWKLPIVYGGVAGITYAITWNSKYYNDYYNAYRDYMDSNPNSNSYKDLLPANYPEGQIESYLNSRQRTFRRYRDLSIIVGVAFYAITVVDAFVDAQLAEFDISPDLSMKVKPQMMESVQSNMPSMGCALQIKF